MVFAIPSHAQNHSTIPDFQNKMHSGESIGFGFIQRYSNNIFIYRAIVRPHSRCTFLYNQLSKRQSHSAEGVTDLQKLNLIVVLRRVEYPYLKSKSDILFVCALKVVLEYAHAIESSFAHLYFKTTRVYSNLKLAELMLMSLMNHIATS